MPRCDTWRAAPATSRVLPTPGSPPREHSSSPAFHGDIHRVADRDQLLPSPGERPSILGPQPRRDPDAGGHVDRTGATQRWELDAAQWRQLEQLDGIDEITQPVAAQRAQHTRCDLARRGRRDDDLAAMRRRGDTCRLADDD